MVALTHTDVNDSVIGMKPVRDMRESELRVHATDVTTPLAPFLVTVLSET